MSIGMGLILALQVVRKTSMQSFILLSKGEVSLFSHLGRMLKKEEQVGHWREGDPRRMGTVESLGVASLAQLHFGLSQDRMPSRRRLPIVSSKS